MFGEIFVENVCPNDLFMHFEILNVFGRNILKIMMVKKVSI